MEWLVVSSGGQHYPSLPCIAGVSHSEYYATRRRLKELTICTTSIQAKPTFVTNHRCYGSRRIVDKLKTQGIIISRYKMRRLMREAGIKPVWQNKFVNTTDSQHELPWKGVTGYL